MPVAIKVTLEGPADNFADLKAAAAEMTDCAPDFWIFEKARAYRTEDGRAIDLNFTKR